LFGIAFSPFELGRRLTRIRAAQFKAFVTPRRIPALRFVNGRLSADFSPGHGPPVLRG
jgi:hypothetical protein